MCKFIKRKQTTKEKRISLPSLNVFALNIALCCFIVVLISLYAVLAVGNTSRELALQKVQTTLAQETSGVSELEARLNEEKNMFLSEETLRGLGLVGVGRIEYAKAIGGQVAIR